MRRRFAILALALAGCSVGSGQEPQLGVPAPPPRLVTVVDRLELGRTADGGALVAHGRARGVGWSKAQLRLRPDEPGADGHLDFDMIATPPDAVDPARAQRLRADALVPAAALDGLAGLRVHGEQGAAQLDFAPAPAPEGG